MTGVQTCALPISFDEKLVEQGRNFSNKIWNAFRLVKGWTVTDKRQPTRSDELTVKWFEAKLNQALIEIHDHFGKFRISDALQTIYKLIWDDFCSQYLELIKPAFDQPIDLGTYTDTVDLFERLMQLAHPFMPFITEEIWQQLYERQSGDSICVAYYPHADADLIHAHLLTDFETLFDIISNVRNIRNEKQISPKTALPLAIRTNQPETFQPLESLIQKMANVSDVSYANGKAGGLSFLIKGDEFFVDIAGEIDLVQEVEATRKDLEYQIGFRDSTFKKLSNERFVANANPDVVDRERQKLADAEAKIQALKQRLQDLAT